LDRPASSQDEAKADLAEARAVVAANADKDLRGYTVFDCVEDVNDLRQALGYHQVILVGQSFGSQWSFAIMRLHPEIVARALLSGVEPLDGGYDMPSHVFAALQRVAWEADQDPGLRPYLPEGGLMAAVRAVHDRFVRGPVTVELKDEASSVSRPVTLGLGDVQEAMLAPVESWPALMLSLYHGHYEAWARDVAKQRAAGGETLPLIGPLIDTSLGVTPARAHQLRTDPAIDFLGDWNWASYVASTGVWPTRDVGDDLRVPALSQVPVLFVSGDWDTATPLENTLQMLPFFPNGRVVLVHRGGHGARMRLVQDRPDLAAAIVGYLRTGRAAGLPLTTALPPLVFERPAFAPPNLVKP